MLNSVFISGCSNTGFVPEQTVPSSSAEEEEGNRIITEDTLSPQIIPEKFVSKVLDEESLLRLPVGSRQKQYMIVPMQRKGKSMKFLSLILMTKAFLFSFRQKIKDGSLKKGIL